MSIFQRGFLLIPHKLEFYEGEGYCKKISGRLASYVSKAEFEEIVHHLSLSSNMQAQPCLKSSEAEDTRTIEAYLGGTDEDEEGTWTTLYTRENIQVTWAGVGCYQSPLPGLCSTCPGESTGPTLTVRGTTASPWRRR